MHTWIEFLPLLLPPWLLLLLLPPWSSVLELLLVLFWGAAGGAGGGGCASGCDAGGVGGTVDVGVVANVGVGVVANVGVVATALLTLGLSASLRFTFVVALDDCPSSGFVWPLVLSATEEDEGIPPLLALAVEFSDFSMLFTLLPLMLLLLLLLGVVLCLKRFVRQCNKFCWNNDNNIICQEGF